MVKKQASARRKLPIKKSRIKKKKSTSFPKKKKKSTSAPKKKKKSTSAPKKKKTSMAKRKSKSMAKKKKKKSMAKRKSKSTSVLPKKKKSMSKKKKSKSMFKKKKTSVPKKKKQKPKQKKSESIVKNQGISYDIKPLVKKEDSIICNIVTPNGDKVVLPSEFDARWTYDNLMDRKQRFSYYDNLENMDYLRNKYNEYRAICY